VRFDARTHQAASAVAEGSFKYKDARNEASAVRAHYDIGNDKVVLTAEPGYDPTVVTDGETLKAKLIEFSPRAGTAKATGSVIAQLVGKPSGPSADATTIFPAARPVYVNSDVVTLRQANKSAIFNGNVRAWQETNALFAVITGSTPVSWAFLINNAIYPVIVVLVSRVLSMKKWYHFAVLLAPAILIGYAPMIPATYSVFHLTWGLAFKFQLLTDVAAFVIATVLAYLISQAIARSRVAD